MSSSLCALRDIHRQLLRDYHCVLADLPNQRPSAPVANGPAAPDAAASTLQPPQLTSLAQPFSSGPADGDARWDIIQVEGSSKDGGVARNFI